MSAICILQRRTYCLAFGMLGMTAFALLAANPAWGAFPLSPKSKAQAREAVRAIPFDELNAEAQAKLRRVLARPSIYRRMPTAQIECDPQLYLLMVRNPELVVNMWRLMGVTNVELNRTGEFSFDTADGAGTTSNVELVYGTPKTHVMYADGQYAGPLTRRELTGRCVLLLQSEYHPQKNGQTVITSQLDVFLQLDQIGVEMIAKTLHPLMGKTADSNFMESVLFLGRVSRAAERNGSALQTLANRLKNVDESLRKNFVRLATTINKKAALQQQEKAESPAADNALVGLSESDENPSDGIETRTANAEPSSPEKAARR